VPERANISSILYTLLAHIGHFLLPPVAGVVLEVGLVVARGAEVVAREVEVVVVDLEGGGG
jgi:hypothetical protein